MQKGPNFWDRTAVSTDDIAILVALDMERAAVQWDSLQADDRNVQGITTIRPVNQHNHETVQDKDIRNKPPFMYPLRFWRLLC